MMRLRESGETLIENLLLIGMAVSVVGGIIFSERLGPSPRLVYGPICIACLAGLFCSRRQNIEPWMRLPLVLFFAGLISLLAVEAYCYIYGLEFEQTFGLTFSVFAPLLIAIAWGIHKNKGEDVDE